MCAFKDEALFATASLYREVITRLTITNPPVFNNNDRIDRAPATPDYASSFDFDFGATVDIGNKKMTAFEENLFYMIFGTVIILGNSPY